MGCFALAYTRTIATTRCVSLVNKLRRYSNTAKWISRTKTLKPKSHLHKKIAHYVKKMISSIIDRSLLRNFSNSPSTRGATFSGRRASWKGWATWPPPWIIPSHPSTTFSTLETVLTLLLILSKILVRPTNWTVSIPNLNDLIPFTQVFLALVAYSCFVRV